MPEQSISCPCPHRCSIKGVDAPSKGLKRAFWQSPRSNPLLARYVYKRIPTPFFVYRLLYLLLKVCLPIVCRRAVIIARELGETSIVASTWRSALDERQAMVDDPRIVFGKAVRRARLALGMSQEMLAEEAEMHRTYIGSVERGERNVSLENIVHLARALDTTPSVLLADIR